MDSLLTRDYDDALSIRELDDGIFEVGIHIADAAEFVSRDDFLDHEAEQRASSIYLPDERISMFPASLSEGIFSLKAGEDRLALSFLIKLDSGANTIERRIVRASSAFGAILPIMTWTRGVRRPRHEGLFDWRHPSAKSSIAGRSFCRFPKCTFM